MRFNYTLTNQHFFELFSHAKQRNLDTALCHTMFAPSIFNDVNGDYRGTDKKVYEKENFINYTTFSLWDTYRGLHPLYTMIQPEKINDIVKTVTFSIHI